MSESLHDPRIEAVEAALSALAPLPAPIDRDRLLYRAGQVSMAKGRWAWPGATAVLALVAVTLGVALCLRPAPQPIIHIVHVAVREPVPVAPAVAERPPAPEEADATTGVDRERWLAQADHLKLREQVLRWGLDVLPNPPPGPALEPPPPLERQLGLPPRSLDRPSSIRLNLFPKLGDPS
jgi:hypothetical protein